MPKSKSGFTIVELLIVIVVIAILASITLVSYNGTQKRARDARRIADAGKITDALDLYYLQNGSFPTNTLDGITGSWEKSSNQPAGKFMEYLATYGFTTEAPRDPINNAVIDTPGSEKTAGKSAYYYYKYPAGSMGCNATRGDFYVLGITSFEASSGTVSQSPGFSCSGFDWQTIFAWVTGGYEH